MNETPLIYTSKGNMPIDMLTRKDGWEFDANGVSYWEEYHLSDELVKRSVARYQLPPPAETIQQGSLG